MQYHVTVSAYFIPPWWEEMKNQATSSVDRMQSNGNSIHYWNKMGISTLGNSLSFAYDFQMHTQEMTQVKLALQNKLNLSFVCMTKLFLSAQRLKAGFSLLLIFNYNKAKTLEALPRVLPQDSIIISSLDRNLCSCWCI